jgi:hypothetical protein
MSTLRPDTETHCASPSGVDRASGPDGEGAAEFEGAVNAAAGSVTGTYLATRLRLTEPA